MKEMPLYNVYQIEQLITKCITNPEYNIFVERVCSTHVVFELRAVYTSRLSLRELKSLSKTFETENINVEFAYNFTGDDENIVTVEIEDIPHSVMSTLEVY